MTVNTGSEGRVLSLTQYTHIHAQSHTTQSFILSLLHTHLRLTLLSSLCSVSYGFRPSPALWSSLQIIILTVLCSETVLYIQWDQIPQVMWRLSHMYAYVFTCIKRALKCPHGKVNMGVVFSDLGKWTLSRAFEEHLKQGPGGYCLGGPSWTFRTPYAGERCLLC